ncbi:hypothetical protein BANRA_05672 [Klebsiella pneumoniae]|nr:hypothetical protein BANRA_05672 [Klebsiella pneumoniae]
MRLERHTARFNLIPNQGITEAAKKSGLARQSIYRALSPNGNPTITTLAQLAAVAGLQFTLSKPNH